MRVFGDEDAEYHETEDCVLEPDVVIEGDGEEAHIRNISTHFTHYVPLVDPFHTSVPLVVQPAVVHLVVVAFCQQIRVAIGSVLRKLLLFLVGDHAMHYGYGLAGNTEYNNVSGNNRLVPVGAE